jgi:hypothetical protein
MDDTPTSRRDDRPVESSLHRDLKRIYADREAPVEAKLGRYRIDVAAEDQLIEIQASSLSAIREKVRELCRSHRVLVVKPIPQRKYIVKRDPGRPNGIRRRLSPKRGRLLDIFDDLVHFAREFADPNLTLEVLLTEEEELRVDKPTPRWRRRNYRLLDRVLLRIVEIHRFAAPADFRRILPSDLRRPFTTASLAAAMDEPVWLTRRIAYSLRHMGAISPVGKQGNMIRYDFGAA